MQKQFYNYEYIYIFTDSYNFTGYQDRWKTAAVNMIAKLYFQLKESSIPRFICGTLYQPQIYMSRKTAADGAVSAIPLTNNKTRHRITMHMDAQCTTTASVCLFLRTITIEKTVTHFFLCPYSCIHPRQMSVLMS
jgi:hypothetical protein